MIFLRGESANNGDHGCLRLKLEFILLENILKTSLDKSNKQFDGFPLILVLFDIVHKTFELIRPQKKL